MKKHQLFQVLVTLLGLGYGVLVIVVVCSACCVLGSGVRCFRLLGDEGLTLGDSVKGYLLSSYASLFLPTAIGGDAVRVEFLSVRGGIGRGKAAGAVVAERVSGLISMMVFLGVALIVLSDFRWGFSAELVLLLFSLFLGIVWGLSKAHTFDRGPQWFREFSSVLHSFNNRGIVIELVLWSMLVQFLAILVPVSVGLLSPNGDVNVALQLAGITPVVWMIIMVPISLGGNGLREVSYVAIAEILGMDKTIALTAGISLTVFNFLPALVGAFLFNSWNKNSSLGISEVK